MGVGMKTSGRRRETHLTSILSPLKGGEEALGECRAPPSPPFRGEKDGMRWVSPICTCPQKLARTPPQRPKGWAGTMNRGLVNCGKAPFWVGSLKSPKVA